MKDGFLRVAAATPDVSVADIAHNVTNIDCPDQRGKQPGCQGCCIPGALYDRLYL